MPVEAGQRAKAAPAPSPAPARQTVADPAWTSLQALETAAGAGMSAGAGKAVSEEDASWFAAGGRRIVEDFVQISRQITTTAVAVETLAEAEEAVRAASVCCSAVGRPSVPELVSISLPTSKTAAPAATCALLVEFAKEELANHCGVCGASCPSGNQCLNGQCTLVCGGSTTNCGGSCVELASSSVHCGACETSCGDGFSCVSGTCTRNQLVCPSGETNCGERCVDLLSTDVGNCGSCGATCNADETCSAGTCELVCAEGQSNCRGTCVSLASSDVQNCGACGTFCDGTCAEGRCSVRTTGAIVAPTATTISAIVTSTISRTTKTTTKASAAPTAAATFAVLPTQPPSLSTGSEAVKVSEPVALEVKAPSGGVTCSTTNGTCKLDTGSTGRYTAVCAASSVSSCDVITLRNPSDASKCLVAQGTAVLEAGCPPNTRLPRVRRSLRWDSEDHLADLYRRFEKRAPLQMPYWTMYKVRNETKLINANLNETTGCLLALPNVQVGSCASVSSGQWALASADPPTVEQEPPIGAIVGGVIAGVVVLAAVGGGLYYSRKRKVLKAPENAFTESIDEVKAKATGSATTLIISTDDKSDRRSEPSSGVTASVPNSMVISQRTIATTSDQSLDSTSNLGASEGDSSLLPVSETPAGASAISGRPGTIEPGLLRPPSVGSQLHRVYQLFNRGPGTPAKIAVNAVGRATRGYQAVGADELELEVGDEVDVELAFSDGWAFGTNTRTGKRGFFPADFLDLEATDMFSSPSVPQEMDSAAIGTEPTSSYFSVSGRIPLPVPLSDSFVASVASMTIPPRSTSRMPSAGLPLHVSSTSPTSPQSPTSAATSNIPAVPTSRLLIQESDVVIDRTKKLGSGGFGVVYEGRLRGNTRVAIKTLRGEIDDRSMDMFIKEVQNWAGLVQRNVLPLMAFCVSPPLIVMDLMREGNLRQYLSGRGWNEQRGKELLLDVSEGMIYLHSLGILHGDLKSLNVLVDGSRAVITDFGLSKLLFEVSRSLRANTQHVAGTPNFSSPELLNGAMIQPPADVYAYGMVCYEVVSKGLYPFGDKANLGAIVFSVVVKQETPERPEGVEDEMWALMKRCWSYEPGERPDFVKVRDDLERLV